jgi:hypothetical protein
MTDWAYVALSFLTPLAWGLLVAFLFRRLDERRAKQAHGERPLPGDYSI